MRLDHLLSKESHLNCRSPPCDPAETLLVGALSDQSLDARSIVGLPLGHVPADRSCLLFRFEGVSLHAQHERFAPLLRRVAGADFDQSLHVVRAPLENCRASTSILFVLPS